MSASKKSRTQQTKKPRTSPRKSKTALAFGQFVDEWNALQELSTPDLHRRIVDWLERKYHAKDRRLLLCAFRNSGKSTLVGLFSAWILVQDPNTRILVWAADFALAKKMVRNVKRIIERHPRTQALVPVRMDQWAADQFTVVRSAELRDPSMLAKGIGANVTGSRADVVICDDVEVPNTCDTPGKRADLRARLAEIDYILVPDGFTLYVGTPHSYFTIYATEARPEDGESRPFLHGFSRLSIPILDAAGNSAWPERFPAERIAEIRERTGPKKFRSQMLLQPTHLQEARLSVDELKWYDDELIYTERNGTAALTLAGRRLISASCCWDPSFGAPGQGDANVIAAVFTDDAGEYWLHRIAYLCHDPARADELDEATQLCRQVVGFARALFLPAVAIETNGLGRFLPGLLRREFSAAGLRCAVVERVAVRRKALRIVEAFDAVLAAGHLHTHRSVNDTAFVREMREWHPDAAGHDDGLDAVAACLLSEPVRLPTVTPGGGGGPRPGSWRPGLKPFPVQSDFAP